MRCDSRETGKSPNRDHRGPHATAATGPSQAIAEVELGSTFAMRCDVKSDLAYDFDLFYSKVVQRFKSCLKICTSCIKPREYHGDVAKSARLCRITEFFCEWYFASSHRTHPSQIASHRVSHRERERHNGTKLTRSTETFSNLKLARTLLQGTSQHTSNLKGSGSDMYQEGRKAYFRWIELPHNSSIQSY